MKRHVARAVVRRSGAAALALVTLAVLGAVFVTGAGASPKAPAGSATYTDPAGDAQGGPDVTKVIIDGDSATQTLTFTVTAANVPSFVSDEVEKSVSLWLDTDRDRATGDPWDGTDATLQAWVDSAGRWWFAGRWNGTDFGSLGESPTLGFTRSGDVFSWTVSTVDLGGATNFRFYALAGIWDLSAKRFTARDDAPDTGWWEYDLSATTQAPPATPPAAPPATAESKVSLLIGAPSTTPKQATAGKRLTVDFRVAFQEERPFTSIDLGTGETKTGWTISWTPVQDGKMICDPSVAGKVIAHAESFKNGRARLSFVIPKTAKAKILKVQVKIIAKEPKSGQTLTAKKVATLRVK